MCTDVCLSAPERDGQSEFQLEETTLEGSCSAEPVLRFHWLRRPAIRGGTHVDPRWQGSAAIGCCPGVRVVSCPAPDCAVFGGFGVSTVGPMSVCLHSLFALKRICV